MEKMTLKEMKEINEINNDNLELKKGNSKVSIAIKRGRPFNGNKPTDIIKCECGIEYKRGNKVHHIKSSRHLLVIQKMDEYDKYQRERYDSYEFI